MTINRLLVINPEWLERMKTLRVVLFVIAFLLFLVDVRAVEFLLHGPDVLHVVPDGDAFRALPYRLTAGDYAAFAILLALHATLVFGFIRTKRA